MNGELDPAGTDEPLGPVEELTETLHRWVDRGIRPVVVLILLYYGGSQYGSHYISRPLWQNVILWPIFLVGFAIVLAEDVGGKRAGKPKKVSRWLARKLVARRERKGAPVACQVSILADQAEDGSGEPIEPLPGESVYQTVSRRPAPSSRRNAWILARLGLVLLASTVVVAALIWLDRSSSPANQVTEDQLRSGDCLTGSNLGLDNNSPWPDSFMVVPCTKQHIAEVFFSDNAWPQSQAYPGDNAVDNQADDRCNAAFTVYDGGTTSDNSEFTYDTVDPVPADDWASGDRWLVCVAFDSTSQYPGGAPVDYSIKSSNR